MVQLSRDLLGKPNSDGEIELCVTVSNDGKNIYVLHSGVFLLPKYFVSGNINFFVKRPGSSEELKALQEKRDAFGSFFDRVYNIVRITEGYIAKITDEWIISVLNLEKEGKLQKTGNWITLESVIRAIGKDAFYHYKIKGGRCLYDFFKQYSIAESPSAASREKYDMITRLLFRLELYHRIVLRELNYTLDIDSFTKKHIEDIKYFAINEGDLSQRYPDDFSKIVRMTEERFPRLKGFKLSNKKNNQVITWLMIIKKVFRYLRQTMRETDNDPFESYEIGVREVGSSKPYLTYIELDILRKYPFEQDSQFDQQRDILLFHCLTGLRYRDMIKLTLENVHDHKIVYDPIPNVKENIPAEPVIEFNDEVLDLIEKYEESDYWGRLFPFVCKHMYEEQCCKLLKACGITRLVPVHDPKTKSEINKPLSEVFEATLPIRTYNNLKGIVISEEQEPVSVEKTKRTKTNKVISDDVLMAAISLLE